MTEAHQTGNASVALRTSAHPTALAACTLVLRLSEGLGYAARSIEDGAG